ncbi:hypothetical protein SDC9_156189 [bioreactor metagenome]|uniref:Uncharacterized protein n=1 Tax=bioreactor metagenome TaxID=1076179 RepID=A0A645F3R2_9ZZZZ
MHENLQFARLQGMPGFALGQGLGGHDGIAIVSLVQFGKIHVDATIEHLHLGEGRAPVRVIQAGGAMGDQQFAIGQQVIEGTVTGKLRGQMTQGPIQRRQCRWGFAKAGAQPIEQCAECSLRVGRTLWMKEAVVTYWQILQVAVVCKNPLTPPKHPDKRVAVCQRDFAVSRLAHMGNDIACA